ncbi:N-acetylglucosamine kinase [Peribacillus loiseleuriae]|uniref:ATPase n=1 Tax=Peribacillus loiseleuriae TaxID=1679170 RepID=A0A0K9GWA7_9BACI|nr:BadF/BadG/BcrA/BcrD ATPase family protein [Peribacillus loiseleuriae]KMY50918.1 ATPase [Peribacillus loiseleuriae]
MKYLIGVDGGGTKTEAAAYDLNGNLISTGMSGYGNLLINEDQAIFHIIDAITQCLLPLKKRDCCYLYLGLAGYGGVTDTRTIEESIRRSFNIPFTIENDGIIAHAALLKGKEGILTIAGTGSVSMAVHNRVYKMAGGWGHLLGDQGSGYWIALEAFKRMTYEEDNQQAYSPLTGQILTKLGYKSVADIKKFIYSSSKGEIASIVPLIVDQAKAGDDIAQTILMEAGCHLANTTLAVYHKLPFPAQVTVAIKGGILTNIPIVQEAFIDKLKAMLPETQFVLDEVSSTLGCYYLAMEKMKD